MTKGIKNYLATGIMAASFCAAPFAETAFADGKSAGDLLVRGRIINVAPDVESTVGVIGGNADVDDAVVPELDFTYFFTDNIAAELILATSEHDVMVKGSGAGDVDLGSVWVLPPTVTLQYHFAPKEKLSPYVGVGVNYTIFYNESTQSGSIATHVEYDNGFGWALQGGVDVEIKDGWYANIDLKKLFLKTDVLVNGAIPADVDLDPLVLGVGIGRIF